MYVPETTIIPAGKHSVMVNLQIGFEVPEGHGMFFLPRSSMGTRTPIRLSNSVVLVDSDYRGVVRAYFDNLSDEDYIINPGERVVQGIIVKIPKIEFIEAETLTETKRGASGYGSTGK